MPVNAGQPCEPAVHIFAMRLAYRLVEIIQPCLRPEEVAEAAPRVLPKPSGRICTSSSKRKRQSVRGNRYGIRRQG